MNAIGPAVGVALLLGACAGSAGDPAIDAAVAGFYAPYTQDTADPTPDWDRPIFSAGVRALVAQWKRRFSAEDVAALQDFGWLCECQDWDPHAFKTTVTSRGQPDADHATLELDVVPGPGETHRQTLALVREQGRWVIDDIHADSFPEGLRAALATAMAESAGAPS